LNGEDKAHIARLAETEAPLPPILVNRRTMRVIDGMHRLMAASLQGRETIDVVFFDGSDEDVFLRAVQENIAHGLPLSHADRRAAGERIIASHPHMSDRAIGLTVGLAAKTVANIRKRSSDDAAHPGSRIGKDGRTRPLDGWKGRRRAAELLVQRPEASLRDVARAVGIAPATVLDVRKRLERGESPVPSGANAAAPSDAPPAAPSAVKAADGVAGEDVRPGADGGVTARSGLRLAPPPAAVPDTAATVDKLLRDPALRSNEQCRGMLRLLHANAAGADQLPDVTANVPPHCVPMIVQLARRYERMWRDFARELDGRARIIDPAASSR
jgi:ParB-like chromosome segregation protein Spo0J